LARTTFREDGCVARGTSVVTLSAAPAKCWDNLTANAHLW
jgi:hypothetical protein